MDTGEIGGGYYVRVTLLDGAIERIEGFKNRKAKLGRGIRNESVILLYDRIKKINSI